MKISEIINITSTNYKTYPEVYIPREIIKISKDFPPLPEEPKEPKFPEDPKPPEKDNSSPGVLLIICAIFIITIIILISNGIVGGGEMITYLVILIILVVFCSIFYFGSRESNIDKENKYRKDLQNYHNKVKKYEEDKIEYKKLMVLFEKDKKDIQSKKNIYKFRQERLKEFLFEYSPLDISKIYEENYIKKGVSETFFISFLNILKNFKIYTDCKIYIPNSNNKGYFPDFILVNNSKKIVINLEIDEPYNAETGEPIHYFENHKSIDEKRNDFFTDNKWIVIRFAEQQIFQHPELCVKLIKVVIKDINSINFKKIKAPKQFIIKKWTKIEAHNLAYKKFRHSYIPKEYRLKIQI